MEKASTMNNAGTEYDKLADDLGIIATGISSKSRVEKYDKWAETYDHDLLDIGLYKGPFYAAEALTRHFENKDKDSARILDVAAGTGLVGKYLWDAGFRSIDALDPSSKMLELAKERGFYKNVIESFFTGEETPGIKAGTYDGLIVSGGMHEGLIQPESLREMARCVKPGGFIVNAMRKEVVEVLHEYTGILVPLMEQIEEEGVWKILERKEVPVYLDNIPGIVFVIKRI